MEKENFVVVELSTGCRQRGNHIGSRGKVWGKFPFPLGSLRCTVEQSGNLDRKEKKGEFVERKVKHEE